MAVNIIRESDASGCTLEGLVIAVLGYGNQGRAHALNLRDSGARVVVGQRQGKSAARASQDGFDINPVSQAAQRADLLILAFPDEAAGEIYAKEIAPHVGRGQTLGFVHGFNIRFGFISPPADVDVVMVAPKGPGTLLRSLYLEGKGLPALLAIAQNASGNARRTALAWAAGIGSLKAAVVETTFAAETETDLFGEQAVLCGGITALTKAAFDTLVEAGYEPEFAYLECVHELKQIADLLYERGLTGMREAISNTAEYGDHTRGPRIVSDTVRREMRIILDEIRSGRFAAEWIAEYRSGAARLRAMRDTDRASAYEKAGEVVRSLMPWLKDKHNS
jgi:ketol-acid reductoisomerase